jgi:hypothetical protein
VKSEGVFPKKTRHLLFFTIFSAMPSEWVSSRYLPGVMGEFFLKIELMVLKNQITVVLKKISKLIKEPVHFFSERC